MKLDLSMVPQHVHGAVHRAFASGDVPEALVCISSDAYYPLLIANADYLRDLGVYEEALFNVYTCGNHDNIAKSTMRSLFNASDRAKLRSCGDDLPGQWPLRVYRGIHGRGAKRIERGLSWTTDQRVAYWFAFRFPRAVKPAVFAADIMPEHVYFAVNERDEREVVCDIPLGHEIMRIR